MTGRTILSVAYGIHARDRNDYYISLAKQALDVVAKATEKGRLINLIPARMSSLEPSNRSNSPSSVNDIVIYFPSWFPGAGFKREAESWARSMNAIVEEPFAFAKKAMVILTELLCVIRSPLMV
jgi:hypothetical protein